ncbi:hypothetical protein DRO61_02180 [Candidatus Bathyarchaeota archaeon]|nr:MAG: hypothetical protein DRO61_02180 [Candidatus Bathyarchaeota archaeon]
MVTKFNSTGTGYNIDCDPGTLYNRKCYVNVHDPPGCDPADPACTVVRQEIIGYTSKGDPISKASSDASWIAWVPTLTTLDDSGTAYQPYGEAGLPYGSGAIATSAGTRDVTGDSSDSSAMQDNNPGGSSSEGSEVSASTIQVVAGLTLFSAAAFGIKQWFDARGGKLF